MIRGCCLEVASIGPGPTEIGQLNVNLLVSRSQHLKSFEYDILTKFRLPPGLGRNATLRGRTAKQFPPGDKYLRDDCHHSEDGTAL